MVLYLVADDESLSSGATITVEYVVLSGRFWALAGE
jgi:hypothetical protein